MTFWWLVDSVRLGVEKEVVEALSREGLWFVLQRWTLFECCVAAEGIIRVHGLEYPVRLVYPDQFPKVPAWVEPQDATAKWSNHQYGAGGNLCLEFRPDNWVETATGADVLYGVPQGQWTPAAMGIVRLGARVERDERHEPTDK